MGTYVFKDIATSRGDTPGDYRVNV